LRKIVTGMCVDWGVSIRRACGAIRFDTSTSHDKSRRTDRAAVERRIKEIAETGVRYGSRRVQMLLRRGGYQHEEDPQDLQ
jgi:putative transposase